MRPFFVLSRNHLFGLRTAVRELREQPRLKVWVVGSFSVGWLLGLGWLFYEGFAFLSQRGGVAFVLVPKLFTLFFLGLGMMLMLSGAVTGYANLFQTPEVQRLRTWPVPFRDLFYYSLLKSTLMSSWAFFFIIVPMITAYGLHERWSWPVMLGGSIAYSVPYVMLFSGLGVLGMLLVVRWIPRGRTLWLLGGLCLVGLVTWAVGYVDRVRASSTGDMLVLARLIPGLRLASHPLMPNRWIARGILSFEDRNAVEGGMYLLLLTTSVGVLFLWMARVGEWIYPAILQRHLHAPLTRATAPTPLSRVLSRVYPGRGMVRAYGVKDGLLFLRDPAQWSQFLIFFGLLGLYFLNLGSLGYADLGEVWSNLVAFLNLFSLSAVMSSLSARFVFPQLSLEARTLWMVGLAPHSLGRLMGVKFCQAALVLGTVGVGLSSLSNHMLRLSAHSLMLSRVLMPCMAVALAGMSTGLGAVFMETRPKTPSQILSGYGGTLNLILSLVTVLLLVMVPGVVSHLLNEGRIPADLVPHVFPLTLAYMVLLSGLAGGLPLFLGRQALRSRDF